MPTLRLVLIIVAVVVALVFLSELLGVTDILNEVNEA